MNLQVTLVYSSASTYLLPKSKTISSERAWRRPPTSKQKSLETAAFDQLAQPSLLLSSSHEHERRRPPPLNILAKNSTLLKGKSLSDVTSPLVFMYDFHPVGTLASRNATDRYRRNERTEKLSWRHLEHSYYRPRSKDQNTFGSTSVCVCVCVCVSVHLSVGALLFEPFDLQFWFLAWGSTLTLASLGL